ncbi:MULTISPECIES: hypothetical protein [Megamonas]|jgi:hypothetical protein|uniref:hypothetical protein n=1 Tax=Megamonas TaxID=158846 RepID=UPI000E4292F3|nr:MULTISPECIES: hypothetical protein [Megamonas]RGO06074.1 hypothetical protein DXB32_01505 [Megamonas rupellensis]
MTSQDNYQEAPPMDDAYLSSLETMEEPSEEELAQNTPYQEQEQTQPVQKQESHDKQSEVKQEIHDKQQKVATQENATAVQSQVQETESEKKNTTDKITTDSFDTISEENDEALIEEQSARTVNERLQNIFYFTNQNNSEGISPVDKAYLEMYQKIIKNLPAENMENKDIISEKTDRFIIRELSGKFNADDIFSTVKRLSPLEWENENLTKAIIQEQQLKKQEAKKDSEEYAREYAHRLETILYVLHQDKEYSPVEKAYLTAYHDAIANLDIESTQYKEAITTNLEKELADELIKQDFKEDEIIDTIEKYSPLQLKAEEIDNLLHPNQKEKDIDDRLENENFVQEELCTNSDIKNIMQNCEGNAVKVRNAILIKTKTTYDAFIRLNRIRNFPRFITKLSDNPKYFYLKEASKLRELQLQGRILSNKDEIALYKQSQNDTIIASRLMEKGCNKEDIASLMKKYSPLRPNDDEIKLILQNAEILYKMEKLSNVNVEETAVKNVADEFVLEAKQVMLSNLTKGSGALWNNEANSAVIKALLNKGYAANKIIPIVAKLSPLPINEEAAKNLVFGITGQVKFEINLKEFLAKRLKCKNITDVKIIDEALKKDFPELKNKKTITSKRNFIQSELKIVKKQTKKLSR